MDSFWAWRWTNLCFALQLGFSARRCCLWYQFIAVLKLCIFHDVYSPNSWYVGVVYTQFSRIFRYWVLNIFSYLYCRVIRVCHRFSPRRLSASIIDVFRCISSLKSNRSISLFLSHMIYAKVRRGWAGCSSNGYIKLSCLVLKISN